MRASTPECLLIAVVALASFSGCELVEKARDTVVTEHRAHARGRVGVFRALQTKDRAVAVATAIHDFADPACALPVAPFGATVELRATATVPGGRHEVRDVRRISVQKNGDVQVRYRIEWTDDAGRGDVWTRVDTVMGDKHYVEEQNLPAVAHTRRPATAREVLRRGLDTVRAGLHAGGSRWAPTEAPPEPPDTVPVDAGHSDASGSEAAPPPRLGDPDPVVEPPPASSDAGVAEPAGAAQAVDPAAPTPRPDPMPVGTMWWRIADRGGRTFRGCADPADRGWLRDLQAAAELGTAQAALSPNDRRFRGTWTLEANHKMTLDIRERIRESPEPFGPPERVEDVRRDRPYRDIERILGERLGLSEWKP